LDRMDSRLFEGTHAIRGHRSRTGIQKKFTKNIYERRDVIFGTQIA
jgi:hypothetical protein